MSLSHRQRLNRPNTCDEMKNKPTSSISFPRGFVWSVEDWKDFYQTLLAFKRRVLKRHGLDGRGKKIGTRKTRADHAQHTARKRPCND
jgi:hypothetical protein